MQDYLIYLISLLITLPLISTLSIYMISMLIKRHKWKAIHRAVHWSTIFYVMSVSIMLELIFGHHFIGGIIILLITLLAVIIFVQWKKGQDVDFTKALKLMVRITFLVFFILYACLLIVGIVTRFLT